MKWSSEVAEDKNSNPIVFNYAFGKLPKHKPKNHRVLYVEDSEKLRDDYLKRQLRLHFIVSSYLLG